MSSADQYTLETPENIEVEFEPAGLGSRFCAMLIDTPVDRRRRARADCS